jgi:hypothetical protein
MSGEWGRDGQSGQFQSISARGNEAAMMPAQRGAAPPESYCWGDREVEATRPLPSVLPRQPRREAQVEGDEYARAERVLWREDVEEAEAEEAADRLVRYGMFLCRDRVEPVIARLIKEAPHIEARRLLVDVLADYDVPLGDVLRAAIMSRLASEHRGEFLGALVALLGEPGVEDASERLHELMQAGLVTPERGALARQGLKRLIEVGGAR